jgi:hypothetical protein
MTDSPRVAEPTCLGINANGVEPDELNSNSELYQFLCFYKIIESIR